MPPDLGGLALDLVAYAMIVEELGRGWVTAAALARGQAIAARLVAGAPRPVRERLVPAMTRGERWATLVPGDAIDARPRAGGWTLDGGAAAVESAARADLFLVAGGAAGCFLVERGAHRLAVGPPLDTLGARGLEACALRVDGVELAGSARLAHESARAAEALWRLSDEAIAVGLAQAAFEAALR